MTDERAQAAEGPIDLQMTHHPTWLAVRALSMVRHRVRAMEAMNAEVVAFTHDLLRILATDAATGYHLGDEVCANAHGSAGDLLEAGRALSHYLTLADRTVSRVDRIIHGGDEE